MRKRVTPLCAVMSTKETQDKESATDVDEEETSVSSYASPKDHISVSSGCSDLHSLTQANGDDDAPALERLTREETSEVDEMVQGGENEDDNNAPNPSPSSSEEVGAKLRR